MAELLDRDLLYLLPRPIGRAYPGPKHAQLGALEHGLTLP